jgi:myo-inositol-1(or 4)-monophosphatase
MDEYVAFAKKLAYDGGAIIEKHFTNKTEQEIKQDGSPVTAIDKEINKLVISSIKSAYPDHGILGEEESYGSGNEEYQWLCDPIDGTKCFILGIPACVFMLALAKNGKILMTVIYNPFEKKLYHAVKGGGSFCNNEHIHVNKEEIVGGYILFGEYRSLDMARSVVASGGLVELVPGTGYKCTMIASGRGSGMIKVAGDVDYHDLGPGSLLVEEAGGKVTDLAGNELSYDEPIITGVIISNAAVYDSLLSITTNN